MRYLINTIADVQSFLESRHQYGIKLGLERIKALLNKLNHPEKDLKVVHVAGTNGKGSTIEFMKDSLMLSNYRVGIFSSPSFTGLKGHFNINDDLISDYELIQLAKRIKPLVEELDHSELYPTSFEIITALAFLYFKSKTDIVIVEAGMGGRGDTTNVVQPIISVITTIARDHTDFLGHTIEEIAYEKAGIIKQNSLVITGDIERGAMKIIEREAEKQAAKLLRYKVDYELKENTFIGEDKSIQMKTPFLGVYQKKNIALAIITLLQLKDYQIRVEQAAIEQSMSEFTILGRFEKISNDPIIILDSAHNVAGVEALKESLQTYFKEERINILFAAFKDKEVQEMIEQLKSLPGELYVTTFNHDRALALERYEQFDVKESQMMSDWQSLVREWCELKTSDVYVITGSMHFIMEVRHFLKE